MKPGLTEKQKRFIDFYVETANATEAARRAGYKKPHVQGARLLDNVRVRNAIAERMKELENARIAKAEEVLAFLTAAVRGELQDEVVTSEGVIQKAISTRDRLKAAELLMKRLGLTLSALEEEEKKAHIEALKKGLGDDADDERVVIIDDLD